MGFFFEYDYIAGKRIPIFSDCGLWTLWAGVATPEQSRRMVRNLSFIEQDFGLSCTDKEYDLPRPLKDYLPAGSAGPNGKETPLPTVPPNAIGGQGELMWMYPAGWAPMQLMAVEGLDAYGHSDDAKRVATRFLTLILNQYEQTAKLWEKYNVVEGTIDLPNSRYGNIPHYGWTMAAAALLGRRVLNGEFLKSI